ncbi:MULTISPECIES: TonB-dependent receptor [unclassified Undibacterium]|uniref:TonB-dependent receptor n=1 Tax=unclassified Undibacterium TaxID=2630295 RepID=UPI002AC99633|nr:MULTISPECIES: TonB-dependent receptor [unclassified Undibacterium]MEB0138956.1 TonB-dependent receptor [Undibacterium sp. CCC2.1]MEB0171713.1 TonB-dependent receptor [Undibacterium sp. CCC1.1]MEB0175587.1 TonB-dependent receptor [Undibacterium sp. CCC3.4]MEB0214915.1 TonB-dependent receptor [Undibacterium sp. 5I2]WPX44900.1 TonB-dependent receptor [Undibacterium sp. CCC3.4]
MVNTYNGKLLCIAAAVSSIFASPAWAQQSSDTATPNAKRSDQIETVTVTAQKRKEDASKVPLSISVMKGEELAGQHITDLSDVTRAVPNVSFSGASGSGSGLSNIEIRGVSSSAGSSTVGVYLDDVSMTTRNLYSLGSAEPKLFDIDRIEVLRGPQGTLYGASSMGGTLKFITNQPDLKERDGTVSSEFSSTKGGGTNYTVNGVYNLPLIKDELALRIGVQQGHNSGFVDQVSPTTRKVISSGINSEDSSVLRAALKWMPTRDLAITPSVLYQEVKSKDIDAFYLALPGNQTAKTVREPGTDKLVVPSVTVNYDMGFADLVAVSSYFARDFNRTQDGTTVNSAYIGGVINAAATAPAGLGDVVAGLPSAVYLNNKVRQFSQEIRLASKPYDGSAAASPVTWIGGVFYSNLKTDVVDNEPVFGINTAFKNAGASISDPAILGSAFPGDNSYFSARHYKTTQTALFGEATYHFSPTVSATVGARYLRATDSLSRDGDLFFAGGPTHSDASSNFNATTPKIALSWQVDPNNSVYASAAQGFRLGGQNRAIPAAVCAADFKNLNITAAPTSFDPDKLWSYEVGSKSRLMGNRVSLNVAAFYIDWNQLQQDIVLPGCGFDYETNVGKAKSYGLEVEMKIKPTSNILLGLSAGYTNAKLATDVPSIGASSGDPIQGVPKYNASLTGQYNFDVTNDVYGFARGAVHWVGASHGSLTHTDPDYLRPAYNTVDASVGASYGNWEVSLFAKNLLNNEKVIQRPNVQSVNEGYRVRPLTIGLSLNGKI